MFLRLSFPFSSTIILLDRRVLYDADNNNASSNNIMNILLTGGTGYIGSHAAVVLSAAGHHPILFDNLSNSKRDVVARLEKIIGTPPTFIEGDVRDTALLSKVINDHEVDAVIHFAGLKAVGESVAKPLEYYSANVQGTISLLNAMQANGVHKIVFSSSATVYGDPQYLPIDEDHPTSATNPYGRTKLHIEEMLSDLSRSSTDWRIVCLRYFNPVGAHESGLIGEDPEGIPNNLMPYVARVASEKLECLSVFGDDYETPDGTGVRDYIHIMDLVEGHLAAIDFLDRHSGWHAINLGTGNGISVLEIVTAFEGVSARKINYKFAPRRPGDVAACYAKAGKAKDVLNWAACRTMSDMCASMWHFQLSLENQGRRDR
jgi:UDP-glucose 4-epimerase